jgi:hypothetical protein
MSEPSPSIPPESLSAGYEVRDVRPRPMLLIALSFIVGVAVVHLIGIGVLLWLDRDQAMTNLQLFPPNPIATTTTPPGPLLEPEPAHDVLPKVDLAEVRARENALIGPSNWDWADANHRFARIPISDAIDLAVKNGLPSVLPATQPTRSFMPPASALHGPEGVP